MTPSLFSSDTVIEKVHERSCFQRVSSTLSTTAANESRDLDGRTVVRGMMSAFLKQWWRVVITFRASASKGLDIVVNKGMAHFIPIPP